jgi:hypothetical protein
MKEKIFPGMANEWLKFLLTLLGCFQACFSPLYYLLLKGVKVNQNQKT